MALRVVVRSLAKNWGYSTAVLLTLALGIGANTTIFCVLNAVLLRPLPFVNADQLVYIWNLYGKSETTRCNVSPPDYFDRKEQATTLSSVAAFYKTSLALTGKGEPEQIQSASVTASLFSTLGVSSSYGRFFLESEDETGSNPVAVISYGLWQRRFGSDKNILGRTINLGGTNHTIVGIAPKRFWFPDQETEIWIPLTFRPEQLGDDYRGNEFLSMVGRVRDGAAFNQVQAELKTIAARVIEHVPDRSEYLLNAGWSAEAVSLRESLFGEVRPTLLMLMCATGFLLLLACANVANLVMTRNLERAREVAVRIALGASKRQLASVFLAESTLLSLSGGILGLLLSYISFGLIRLLAPQDVPRITEIGLDWNVLAFTTAISVITALFFGITPLRMMHRTDLSDSLKEGLRSSSGRHAHRVKHFLIFSEVTIALILFAGAILFARSFMNLMQQNTGFRTENRLSFGITLPTSQYATKSQWSNLYQEVHDQLRTIPGALSSGAINLMPMSDENWTATFAVRDYLPAPGEPPSSFEYRIVTQGYMSAMGIALRMGRDFSESDNADRKRVVLIDEKLAKKYWPGQNPIGRYVGFSDDEPVWREVVGVVSHVRNISPSQEGIAQIYFPSAQFPLQTMHFVIHTQVDPTSVLPEIRERIRSVDRNLPLYRIQTLEQLASESVAKPRFQVLLLGSFAMLALLLATVGIYGVISYSVNQRKNEIGVRMALGATQSIILCHVIQTSMFPVIFGVIAGVLSSIALSRLIRGLLYGISAINFSVLTLAAFLIFMIAIAAAFLPARRASRTDAAIVLRSE